MAEEKDTPIQKRVTPRLGGSHEVPVPITVTPKLDRKQKPPRITPEHVAKREI